MEILHLDQDEEEEEEEESSAMKNLRVNLSRLIAYAESADGEALSSPSN